MFFILRADWRRLVLLIRKLVIYRDSNKKLQPEKQTLSETSASASLRSGSACSLCSEGFWALESVCSPPDDADQSEALAERRVEEYLPASRLLAPSPPGVLLFWTCFNISWRAVCAAPPAPQHALNLHIFGGTQTWRSCKATDAGVSTNECVC